MLGAIEDRIMKYYYIKFVRSNKLVYSKIRLYVKFDDNLEINDKKRSIIKKTENLFFRFFSSLYSYKR